MEHFGFEPRRLSHRNRAVRPVVNMKLHKQRQHPPSPLLSVMEWNKSCFFFFLFFLRRMYGDEQMVHRESRIKFNSGSNRRKEKILHFTYKNCKRYLFSHGRMVEQIAKWCRSKNFFFFCWMCRSKNLKTNCFASYELPWQELGKRQVIVSC